MEFYRCIEKTEYHFEQDYDGEYRLTNFPPSVDIKYVVYKLESETPKGYWIKEKDCYMPHKIWISKTSRKRFAYPTKEEALEAFKYRKESQIRILKDRLYIAETALLKAKGEPIKLTEPAVF